MGCRRRLSLRKFEKHGGDYVVTKAEANRSPDLFEGKEPSVQVDANRLSWLLDGLIGK